MITVFRVSASVQVKDVFTPLPANSIHLYGYLEDYIQHSLNHWNKGVVPYSGFVKLFRDGRQYFAQGEMWGKAVRSGCMFYRYTQDPELKKMLQVTVSDLLKTRRANGSISCSDISKQPDGPSGDLWERKYVLLGLDEYYTQLEKDPAVLKAMIDQADAILKQIGPAPKIRIIDQGWSKNGIESCSILEPIMRLYKLTGYQRYLDFAKYIVEVEGGAKGYNVIEEAFNNVEPHKMGGPWPKAYEMLSLFEGLVEYYRVTGNDHWKQSFMNLYQNIKTREITIIGNGGADQPYHADMYGEGWDNAAFEQTNPDIKRMMETCVGITWMKFCSQIVRLNGDPSAIDYIEQYIYNGLIGALKPSGDGFSYFSWLNGLKSNPKGWGGMTDGVHVTCCTLNGPMGLAYIPYVALMNSKKGPVVNLYNAGTATVLTPKKHQVQLNISTDYPKSGSVLLTVKPQKPENFSIRLRIPSWSAKTSLKVNGKALQATPGTYCDIQQVWKTGDKIELVFDMRCRLIKAPHGSNRAGDHFQALVRGPIVLSRDENFDPNLNQMVSIVSNDGFVEVTPESPYNKDTRMQFRVPTDNGFIHMVDYASVNSWGGKHICTWLPVKE
ncbi:MAG: glycoside hydrolase family 127 protein [Bacteroidales bacterium]|nr:glycoside hydrolase family 127 protein [Bacteroidales bacterium]